MMSRPLVRALLLLLALLLVGGVLFSEGAHHAFHLDDEHSIRNNPALRSLDRIPDYFRDPRTFSILETNVDYRPVLEVSYAVDYALAGYDMPVWHWTQVAIHVTCAFFLGLLTWRLLGLAGVDEREREWVSLLTPFVFLVHPTASGVVHYISARSSALTAAFLLAAFCCDLWGRRWAAVLLLLLGLFTKVEAVAALAVFWAFSVLRRRQQEEQGWRWRQLVGRPGEWWPYLAAVVFYLVVRQVVMQGIDFAGAAAGTDITRWSYLLTQTTVWWVYLFQWFCPLWLVADNAVYPVYRSLAAAPVALALVGWSAVLLLLWLGARKRPHFAVLALSGLALLSPTSSVVPLAEMMNEHRPYLPMALLSIIFVTGLVRLGLAFSGRGSRAVVLLTLVWLGVLGCMTWQRNKVYFTVESYWADVLAKAPSSRAHNNYGLALRAKGRLQEATQHFTESVRMSPGYSVAHINLALSLARSGRLEEARRHYDLAVAYDRGAGEANIWRGRFFLQRKDYLKAEADFLAAGKVSNDHYSVAAGLAQAYAGLGDPVRSAEQAQTAGSLDFERLGRDIVGIATPYFGSEAQNRKGLEFFRALQARWPKVWWIHANLSTLLQRLGDKAGGVREGELGESLRRAGSSATR
jgi:tetratricopeptide (TPR) repeat protein